MLFNKGETMSTWITPKTNWKSTDCFNYWDYNRIKGNLAYLHEQVCLLCKNITIDDMGDDCEWATFYYADDFNKFEKNLEKINLACYSFNIGTTLRFYSNGGFIKYDELNRIESACLKIYEQLLRHKQSLQKIPFTMGRYREVRV